MTPGKSHKQCLRNFRQLLVDTAFTESRWHEADYRIHGYCLNPRERVFDFRKIIGVFDGRIDTFETLRSLLNDYACRKNEKKRIMSIREGRTPWTVRIAIHDVEALYASMDVTSNAVYVSGLEKELRPLCACHEANRFLEIICSNRLLNERTGKSLLTEEDARRIILFLNHVNSDLYSPGTNSIRIVSAQIYRQKNGSKILESYGNGMRNHLRKYMNWSDEKLDGYFDFFRNTQPVHIHARHARTVEASGATGNDAGLPVAFNGPVMPFMILLPQWFRNLEIDGKRIITIENMTTFQLMCQKMTEFREHNLNHQDSVSFADDTILVYTAGQPNHDLLDSLKHIQEQGGKLLYHFGDMDRKGIEIRNSIQKHLALNVPHIGWSEKSLLEYGYDESDKEKTGRYESLNRDAASMPLCNMEKFAIGNRLMAEQEVISLDIRNFMEEMQALESGRIKEPDIHESL